MAILRLYNSDQGSPRAAVSAARPKEGLRISFIVDGEAACDRRLHSRPPRLIPTEYVNGRQAPAARRGVKLIRDSPRYSSRRAGIGRSTAGRLLDPSPRRCEQRRTDERR